MQNLMLVVLHCNMSGSSLITQAKTPLSQQNRSHSVLEGNTTKGAEQASDFSKAFIKGAVFGSAVVLIVFGIYVFSGG